MEVRADSTGKWRNAEPRKGKSNVKHCDEDCNDSRYKSPSKFPCRMKRTSESKNCGMSRNVKKARLHTKNSKLRVPT